MSEFYQILFQVSQVLPIWQRVRLLWEISVLTYWAIQFTLIALRWGIRLCNNWFLYNILINEHTKRLISPNTIEVNQQSPKRLIIQWWTFLTQLICRPRPHFKDSKSFKTLWMKTPKVFENFDWQKEWHVVAWWNVQYSFGWAPHWLLEMMCHTQNNSLTQRSRNVIVLLRISLQSIVKLNAPLNY